MADTVLVTGGAGYIGSHTCKVLHHSGYDIVVYDNLSTGFRHNVKWGRLMVGDLQDVDELSNVFDQVKPTAVIHFAASAYVGESVVEPLKYYYNNVSGTLSLLRVMQKKSVSTLVFSSSCATYGAPETLPIRESTEQRPINPYGTSKLMAERAIIDYFNATGGAYAILRYFNACGADPDGELAEEHDPETHLIPLCLMSAYGRAYTLDVYGSDYPTPDGTCVRDYIHVSDLARAHVSALQQISERASSITLNLGSGSGLSIYNIIDGISQVLGQTVKFRVRDRRPGDPAFLVADVGLAEKELGFTTRFSDLPTILRTAAFRYSR